MKKQTTLFAEWISSYPQGEETMNVFRISGSKEELQEYEEYKGSFLRHCDTTGLPLYYTQFNKGNGPLRISDKSGNYYIDDSATKNVVSKFRAMGLDPEKMMQDMFEREFKQASKPQKSQPSNIEQNFIEDAINDEVQDWEDEEGLDGL